MMNKGDIVKIVGHHTNLLLSEKQYVMLYGHDDPYMRTKIEIGSYATFIELNKSYFAVILTQFGVVEIAEDDIVNL